jgi:predicted peptidase
MMVTRLSRGAWIAILALILVQRPPAAAQTYTVDDFAAGEYTDPTGNMLPYRLFVPRDYDPAKSYPLVTFLHGAGERGTDNRLQLTGQTGELSYINQSTAATFMLAPQCPPSDQWVEVPFDHGSYSIADTPLSPSLRAVLGLQSWVLTQYNIDRTRLYLTGLSMGGYGAWDLSLRFPTLYAAVVPMSGAGDPERAVLELDDAVWAFHGANDSVIPVSGSRDMVNAMRSFGGDPKYTEFPNADHNIWDTAYATRDLIPWTFAQQRRLIVESIVPEPGATIWFLAIGAAVAIVGVTQLKARNASRVC